MASYALEDFVGNGALKNIVRVLVSDGWDDVPTLKIMNAEDMENAGFTQQQKEALELRSYLHDRSLMIYADNFEASGKNLAELLNESPSMLVSEYGMRRGHAARFINRGSACGIVMPPSLSNSLPARRKSLSRIVDSSRTVDIDSVSSSSYNLPPASDAFGNSILKDSWAAKKPKGIIAAAPPTPRLCGLVQPTHVGDEVTPLAAIDKISVQRVTPENKKGIDPGSSIGDIVMPPPMKAGELWANRPALLFIIRRPGCVMCRAEAHQLYARKPIFDSLGINLIAVLGEHIDTEVRAFWPRYWGGMVVADKKRDFFKALGGGNLLKDNLISGFFFNPPSMLNYKRAKASGAEGNLVGEGAVKGGLYVLRAGKGGVAYQFVERNFGDWAPLDEVLEVCTDMQKA